MNDTRTRTHARNGRRAFLRGSATALGWAAVFGAGPGAWLVRAGESADGPGAPDTRAFFAAVRQGDLAGVRERVARHPALVTATDADGKSAYATALLYRQAEVAAFLRESGHAPDLHESALALDWERFEQLAAGNVVAVNADHPIGGTAMHAAALGGASTQIWRVYSQGGDPNVSPRGRGGYTAVRAALEHPELHVAELTAASLLSNGAAPNGPQAGGSSPLHAAARRDSAELVAMLIRKGADLAAVDAAGRTPLELAEGEGCYAAARVLRHHAEIPRDHSTSRSRYDVNGRPYRAPDLSALAIVERSKVVGLAHTNLDAVRAAVEREPLLAHAVATSTEGAIEAGAHMGRADIVDFLLGHGVPYALPTALVRNDGPRAKALLAEDPLRVHERGPHDFPMLWYPALGGGHLEMAELLFAHGAEVERQDWLGTTALHHAAMNGQLELAALLVEHGADVNRRGRKSGGDPRTPLELAAERGHAEMVRFLRERGARDDGAPARG